MQDEDDLEAENAPQPVNMIRKYGESVEKYPQVVKF